jgi:hypothetical protein
MNFYLRNGLAAAIMKKGKTHYLRKILLFTILALLFSNAFAYDQVIKITPDIEVAKMDMRREIATMLESLGYALQTVIDPVNGLQVTVTEKLGKYRMLFTAIDNNAVTIEAHIRKRNGNTSLYFTRGNVDQTDSGRDDYYPALFTRVVNEFGANNVAEQ